MSKEPILPGLEDVFAVMQAKAISDDALDSLPVYTAERVAAHDSERYQLAARLLFTENISRRTICKWLHMSPNTLSAIEVRELRLHPEYVKGLQEESKAEITQLKRLGLEAMRARFFDEKAMSKTGLKEIASALKLLHEMSDTPVKSEDPDANRNTDNDYIDLVNEGSAYYGLCGKKISAPETIDSIEVVAPDEQRNEPSNVPNNGESRPEPTRAVTGENGTELATSERNLPINKGK